MKVFSGTQDVLVNLEPLIKQTQPMILECSALTETSLVNEAYDTFAIGKQIRKRYLFFY